MSQQVIKWLLWSTHVSRGERPRHERHGLEHRAANPNAKNVTPRKNQQMTINRNGYDAMRMRILPTCVWSGSPLT
jgi:hypothetical protein